jgi:GTPase SAR1 family protein
MNYKQKILLWGMAASGKTSFLEILYNMTKEQNLDIKPTSDLVKISMASGATLYFDRAIFQSTLDSNEFYFVYTVPGPKRFSPLRKRLFAASVDRNPVSATSGIILCIDARKKYLSDNIKSLDELLHFVIKYNKGEKHERYLIKDIPLIVIRF